MQTFVTESEIEQLTDYKYPAMQITWLQNNCIRHLVGRSGKPKVLRTELDRILMGNVESKPVEPDFSEING